MIEDSISEKRQEILAEVRGAFDFPILFFV